MMLSSSFILSSLLLASFFGLPLPFLFFTSLFYILYVFSFLLDFFTFGIFSIFILSEFYSFFNSLWWFAVSFFRLLWLSFSWFFNLMLCPFCFWLLKKILVSFKFLMLKLFVITSLWMTLVFFMLFEPKEGFCLVLVINSASLQIQSFRLYSTFPTDTAERKSYKCLISAGFFRPNLSS